MEEWKKVKWVSSVRGGASGSGSECLEDAL